MSKANINECLDCKYEGTDALWLVEGYKGPIQVKETYYVEPDLMDPEYFNLDHINADTIAEKYSLPVELIEDFILDGQPICPKCGSEKYYIKLKEQK